MRQDQTPEQRDEALEKFAENFKSLLAKAKSQGLEVDDIAEVAEAVLEGEWE